MTTILRTWSYQFPQLYNSISFLAALIVGGEKRFHSLPLEGLSLTSQSRILDLCCGGGQATQYLVQFSSRVTGLDASSVALKRALERAPNAQYIQSLAENIPFSQDSFELVHTSVALHEMDSGQLKQILQEVYRVLTPEGHFVLIDFHRPTNLLFWPPLAIFMFLFETETAWQLINTDLIQLLESVGFRQVQHKLYAGGSLQVIQVKKMINKAFNRLLVVFLAVLFLLVGCQPPPTVQQLSSKPITLGTTLKPRSLDPADSYELASLMIVYNLGDTLYTYKLGSTELKPQLAEVLPKISADGLSYTISLRQGIVFHDGTPFNAEAMAFSLERFIKNGGEPSFLLSDSLDKIEAIGEYELRLTLKQPFTALTALLAFPGTCAVSPAAYEIGSGKFNPNNFVGTGPYRLLEMTGDRIKLEAFAKYWGEKPKNTGLDIQLYPGNPANLYNALRTGTVDVAYQSLATGQISKLQKEAKTGKLQVIEGKGSAVNYLSLNLRMEPLKALKVRQAIAAMVDRPFLVERILLGQATPLYTLIPTAFGVSEPVFKRQNIPLAKQLLIEAGFSSTQPAKVEIWYSSGSLNASLLAGILKAIAKRDLAGLLKFEPNSIASAAFFRNISQGLYTSSIANWYPDFLDADNYIYPFLACSKGSVSTGCQRGGAQSQGSFYYSTKMNELIRQQRLEQNPTKRLEIFSQIQTLLAQDVPYIPLWQSKDYAFAQNNLKGVTINPSQTFPFWTLER